MACVIVLADDHALVRQGVRRILESRPEFLVVAEAGSGIEAVSAAARFQPKVVVLDVSMKGGNGLEAIAGIRHVSPKSAVLMLSMYPDERYVRRAMRQGASGYLLKDAVEDELVEAIQTVSSGKQYFSPSLRGFTADTQTVDDRYELLTDREKQIYQMLAEGNANKDIANALGISPHTVETHRARIMDKMSLHSAAELVLSAVRRGIVV
jgi:two-component system, NarL family, response regulator NreC